MTTEQIAVRRKAHNSAVIVDHNSYREIDDAYDPANDPDFFGKLKNNEITPELLRKAEEAMNMPRYMFTNI